MRACPSHPPNIDHLGKGCKRVALALNCGADGLKFFPATLLGESNLIALKAVLPENIPLFMVGGVGPENFSSWLKAGATGFGIGSGIYKAGDSPESVSIKSKLIVQSYDQAKK